MHTTTCSWATIISMIRAIDRMLCNWHSDILTCRPKLVKQIDVKEKVTRKWWFNSLQWSEALIAGCAVGDLDWHWELDPFNTSASPFYRPTLVNFDKLQLFLPKRHLDLFNWVTRISLEYWGEAVPKFIVWNMRPKLIIPNSESLFQTNFGTKVEISHPEAYSQSHTHPEAYTHTPRGTSHVAWEH